jgi:hypothetical protein
MAQGYVAIAQMQDAATRDEGEARLQAATAALVARDTEDARYFAQQLAGVAKFLT